MNVTLPKEPVRSTLLSARGKNARSARTSPLNQSAKPFFITHARRSLRHRQCAVSDIRLSTPHARDAPEPPLGVYDFIKRSSIIAATPQALRCLGPAVVRLADLEGFAAHARAVALRLGGS